MTETQRAASGSGRMADVPDELLERLVETVNPAHYSSLPGLLTIVLSAVRPGDRFNGLVVAREERLTVLERLAGFFAIENDISEEDRAMLAGQREQEDALTELVRQEMEATEPLPAPPEDKSDGRM